jgi:two-component system, cell cycle response regulator DivK
MLTISVKELRAPRAGKRKIRLLIVDDCQDVRDVFKEFLTERGFEVELASDGREAVEMAFRMLPDVIIMDRVMPVMDGWAATRMLKGYLRTSRIPVVVLTADASAAGPYGEERCDGFLTKPCEPDAIIAEIARALESADRKFHPRRVE